MENSEFKEWIDKRSAAVRSFYSTFECLSEHGFGSEIPDDQTPTQISCPVHGPDRRPSARYYPSDGSRGDYVHCYMCKLHADSIELFRRFRGLKWYDSLQELEKRFGIKIPKKPDSVEIEEAPDKSAADYRSEGWQDVPRMLELLERKLLRIRDKAILSDYIKFCRVIDTVVWDLDHNKQEATPAMVEILNKLHGKMNEVFSQKTLEIEHD